MTVLDLDGHAAERAATAAALHLELDEDGDAAPSSPGRSASTWARPTARRAGGRGAGPAARPATGCATGALAQDARDGRGEPCPTCSTARDAVRARPRPAVAPAPAARPAAGADRRRRRRPAGRPRHQGVRPAGHGPARPGDRRDRLRQVRAPAHPGARPRRDPFAGGAQLGAGRLQGRRDLRRHVRAAARLGGDHQPGRRAHPGRPHAGRPVRRDGAPPGAAARRPATTPRVRDYEKARAAGDAARAAAVAVHRRRRVLRDARRPSRSSSTCSSRSAGSAGRSALHLLLASQRLEEGRLRGLETHLSYRIGLRTFSARESRAVLGVPDAYELPRVPGPATSSPDRARCCGSRPRTSPGRYRRRGASAPRRGCAPARARSLPFTDAECCRRRGSRPAPRRGAAAEDDPTGDEPCSTSLVDRIGGQRPAGAPGVAAAARRARHPRRAARPTSASDPERGPGVADRRARAACGAARHRRPAARAAPRPARRSTCPAPAGHVAVVGGPRSGKSTLLRTLVTALALTAHPARGAVLLPRLRRRHVRARCASCRTSAASPAGSSPTWCAGWSPRSPALVDAPRAALPRAGHRLDRDLPAARAGPAAAVADDGYGDVFLVVDGWSTLRAEFEELEIDDQRTRRPRPDLRRPRRARPPTRWTDFRAGDARHRSAPRLELRLGDPIDSEIDRKLAATVPRPARPRDRAAPGPLPRRRCRGSTAGTAPTASAPASRTWSPGSRGLAGPPAPQVRLLPRVRGARPAALRPRPGTSASA